MSYRGDIIRQGQPEIFFWFDRWKTNIGIPLMTII
jgi:hypothetical protein